MTEMKKKLDNAFFREIASERYRKTQESLISDLHNKIVTFEKKVAKLPEMNDEWETKALYHGTAELVLFPPNGVAEKSSYFLFFAGCFFPFRRLREH